MVLIVGLVDWSPYDIVFNTNIENLCVPQLHKVYDVWLALLLYTVLCRKLSKSLGSYSAWCNTWC